MIQTLAARAALLSILSGLALAVPASRAAVVADVYSATASAPADGNDAAFADALRQVIVKASGQAAAGSDSAVLASFGDPARLVQQFRRDPRGGLWVQFDPDAVRRGLEAAGLPVWGEDRPVTVVWLAYDDGAGGRDLVGADGSDGSPAGPLRDALLAAAAARAVPVVLPLRDSEEMARVSAADVWGDFLQPVREASERYQASAILLGRARLFPPGMTDVRWTLLSGDERADWRGGVADGPGGLAERLAERYAARGGAAGAVALTVTGIGSMEDYGRLLAYLGGLEVVEQVAVRQASGDSLQFELGLRGDRARLERALAVRGLIEPAAGGAGAGGLQYRLASRP